MCACADINGVMLLLEGSGAYYISGFDRGWIRLLFEHRAQQGARANVEGSMQLLVGTGGCTREVLGSVLCVIAGVFAGICAMCACASIDQHAAVV